MIPHVCAIITHSWIMNFRLDRTIFIDMAINLSVSVILFLITYVWIAQPHQVSGASMEPTLFNNDYVVTEKLHLYAGLINRGDVVVFKSPLQDSIHLIKRIIAIPGDTIMIIDGSVIINDTVLEETYIIGATYAGEYLEEGEEITVSEGEYILLGDNRIRSNDSRSWGPVSRASIVGVVAAIYWPISRFSISL